MFSLFNNVHISRLLVTYRYFCACFAVALNVVNPAHNPHSIRVVYEVFNGIRSRFGICHLKCALVCAISEEIQSNFIAIENSSWLTDSNRGTRLFGIICNSQGHADGSFEASSNVKTARTGIGRPKPHIVIGSLPGVIDNNTVILIDDNTIILCRNFFDSGSEGRNRRGHAEKQSHQKCKKFLHVIPPFSPLADVIHFITNAKCNTLLHSNQVIA